MTSFCVVLLLLIAVLLRVRIVVSLRRGLSVFLVSCTILPVHIHSFTFCFFTPVCLLRVARPSHTPAHPLTPTHALVCALVFDHTFFM